MPERPDIELRESLFSQLRSLSSNEWSALPTIGRMSDHEERYVRVVKAFILRARRIRAHSLAQDAKLLVELQHPRFTVHMDATTGATRVTTALPPEEQVESAAARVRPLILNGEDTYHGTVMKALSYFVNKAGLTGDITGTLAALKQQWSQIDPHGKEGGHYEVRVQKGDEAESRINDNALAFSWIYGDVVHADTDRREEGRVFGVEERYAAAVPVVVQLMMLAMVTLTTVEWMNANGAFPDLGDVFEEAVVFTEQELAVETNVFVAPYDENGKLPKLPEMGEEYGEGWLPFSEAFGVQIPVPPDSETDEAEQGTGG